MKRVFLEVDSLDKRCYEEFLLSEDILMEHAADALAEEIRKKIPCGSSVFFLCGSGNNGADGIACARILYKEYKTFVMLPYGVKSQMANLQLQRYRALGGHVINDMADCSCYVDALFGSGLKRELDEMSVNIIKEINLKEGYKLACDIPSGIGRDFISEEVFKADKTITMGALKIALFSDFAKDYIGEIEVADLGVSSFVYEDESRWFLLEEEDLKLPFRQRQNSNKGDFGHCVVVKGDKEGASKLASIAAFNFGSGLVSVLGKDIKNQEPFLMYVDKMPAKATALVAGMGLGRVDVKDLLFDFKGAVVLDADMFYKPYIKELLQKGDVVLTPHPKEFASLLEICEIAKVTARELQKDRFGYLEMFVKEYPHVTVVLKGANSIIYSNKNFYINTAGSSILAKGGSGDVLAGMIGSLLAQGYDCADAAITASLSHALVAKKLTCNDYALNPVDLCEGIRWL